VVDVAGIYAGVVSGDLMRMSPHQLGMSRDRTLRIGKIGERFTFVHVERLDHAHSMPRRRRSASVEETWEDYLEAETHALLLRKLGIGRGIAREWLLAGGLTVVPALPVEEQKANEILARHTLGEPVF